METEALGGEGITFRYMQNSKKNILEDIRISFPKGKISVLMGSGGSGKSTLAAILGGLYPENGGILTEGQVRLFGDDIKGYAPAKRAQKVSMMFQNPDLQFCMDTLRKEMIFCLENISCPPEQMSEKIEKAAERLKVTGLLDQPVHSLSGGEKQKAILSCIFLLGSDIILLDEPFANIDVVWAKRISEMLAELNETQKATIIAIDHSLDYWMDKADYIYILQQDGKVQEHIPVAELAKFRPVFEQEGLRYPREVHPGKKRSLSPECVLELREVSVYAEKNGIRRPFLKKNAGRPLLTETDAFFPKGSMTALFGPSGCGKTTLFMTLLKQHRYAGSILVNGKDLKQISETQLFGELGMVFQNPSHQFVTQNVAEEVRLSLPEGKKADVSELLQEFGLADKKKASPYMLSQGQQRRLAVLSVLAGGQQILLLDEPIYGQDDAMTHTIMTMLRRRVEQEGLTVVFTSHDRRLVQEWADRCYVVRDGKMEETDPLEV